MVYQDEHTIVKIKPGKRLKESVGNIQQKEETTEQSGKHND